MKLVTTYTYTTPTGRTVSTTSTTARVPTSTHGYQPISTVGSASGSRGAGSRFESEGGTVGYASTSVEEIKKGKKGEGGELVYGKGGYPVGAEATSTPPKTEKLLVPPSTREGIYSTSTVPVSGEFYNLYIKKTKGAHAPYRRLKSGEVALLSVTRPTEFKSFESYERYKALGGEARLQGVLSLSEEQRTHMKAVAERERLRAERRKGTWFEPAEKIGGKLVSLGEERVEKKKMYGRTLMAAGDLLRTPERFTHMTKLGLGTLSKEEMSLYSWQEKAGAKIHVGIEATSIIIGGGAGAGVLGRTTSKVATYVGGGLLGGVAGYHAYETYLKPSLGMESVSRVEQARADVRFASDVVGYGAIGGAAHGVGGLFRPRVFTTKPKLSVDTEIIGLREVRANLVSEQKIMAENVFMQRAKPVGSVTTRASTSAEGLITGEAITRVDITKGGAKLGLKSARYRSTVAAEMFPAENVRMIKGVYQIRMADVTKPKAEYDMRITEGVYEAGEIGQKETGLMVRSQGTSYALKTGMKETGAILNWETKIPATQRLGEPVESTSVLAKRSTLVGAEYKGFSTGELLGMGEVKPVTVQTYEEGKTFYKEFKGGDWSRDSVAGGFMKVSGEDWSFHLKQEAPKEVSIRTEGGEVFGVETKGFVKKGRDIKSPVAFGYGVKSKGFAGVSGERIVTISQIGYHDLFAKGVDYGKPEFVVDEFKTFFDKKKLSVSERTSAKVSYEPVKVATSEGFVTEERIYLEGFGFQNWRSPKLRGEFESETVSRFRIIKPEPVAKGELVSAEALTFKGTYAEPVKDIFVEEAVSRPEIKPPESSKGISLKESGGETVTGGELKTELELKQGVLRQTTKRIKEVQAKERGAVAGGVLLSGSRGEVVSKAESKVKLFSLGKLKGEGKLKEKGRKKFKEEGVLKLNLGAVYGLELGEVGKLHYATKTATRLKLGLETAQRTKQEQKTMGETKLFTRLGLSSPISTGFAETPPPPPPTEIPFPLFLPVLPEGKKKKGGRGEGFETAFSPKYLPSVEAMALKITGSKPSKAAISTGLGMRPILKGW